MNLNAREASRTGNSSPGTRHPLPKMRFWRDKIVTPIVSVSIRARSRARSARGAPNELPSKFRTKIKTMTSGIRSSRKNAHRERTDFVRGASWTIGVGSFRGIVRDTRHPAGRPGQVVRAWGSAIPLQPSGVPSLATLRDRFGDRNRVGSDPESGPSNARNAWCAQRAERTPLVFHKLLVEHGFGKLISARKRAPRAHRPCFRAVPEGPGRPGSSLPKRTEFGGGPGSRNEPNSGPVENGRQLRP